MNCILRGDKLSLVVSERIRERQTVCSSFINLHTLRAYFLIADTAPMRLTIIYQSYCTVSRPVQGITFRFDTGQHDIYRGNYHMMTRNP